MCYLIIYSYWELIYHYKKKDAYTFQISNLSMFKYCIQVCDAANKLTIYGK